MLIDLRFLCNKYKFVPSGIIHIGAHVGEEHNIYSEVGVENVLWIEANKKFFDKLCNNLSHITTYKFFNYLVSDVDDKEYKFYVTNNEESSSLLELEEHKKEHPHVHVTDTINLKSKTVDSIMELNKVQTEKYNFINLDIQGAELLAMKGAEKLLSKINYVYSEINTKHLYKDCALIDEIDSFLKSHNFQRVEQKILSHGWGDAFYVKFL